MTLIIALVCGDGVVFASDSQETVGTSCKPVKISTDKIKLLGERYLWAASGDVSIIHEIELAFNNLTQNCPSINLTDQKCRQRIRDIVLNIRKQELDRHRKLHGEEKDKDEDADESDLLIVGYDDMPLIWHIDEDARQERFQEVGHYEVIGCGDVFAHTVLKRYEYKTFFKKYDIELSTDKGSLLVYRVLSDSINVSAHGLGKPIVIWIKEPNEPRPRELNEDELNNLKDCCSYWLKKDAEIFKKLKPKQIKNDLSTASTTADSTV